MKAVSKLDRLKEELAIQKQLFFVALAIAIALVGWVATHLDAELLMLVLCTGTIIGDIVFAMTRLRRMYQLLEEIENA